MSLFLISLVSAITIDAGTCKSILIETTNNIFWTASGNSSSIDGINITQEGNNITICLDVMFQEDSFNILFIEEQTKEIIKEVNVGGGGGGKRTVYVDRNINTTEYVYDVIEIPGKEKIVEVPGEEIETIVIPIWVQYLIGVFIILVGVLLVLYLKKDRSDYIDVRRNEYE